MSDLLRYVLISSAGMGAGWVRNVLPRLKQLGKAECVAVVDTNEAALRLAQQSLEIQPEHCFSDVQEALDKRKAKFAVIATPTNEREKLIELCLVYNLHMLMEPPIADNMATTCRIYRRVQDSPRVMALAMDHRYSQRVQSLARQIASNQYGRLNYVAGRFATNHKKRPSWGRFRHEMNDPVLIEAGAQHFDVFRGLCGSDARSIHATSWSPAWAEYRGDSSVSVTIEMQSGAHCLYEGSVCNASPLSPWGEEYYRAECAYGTFELERRELRLIKGDAAEGAKVSDLPLADDQPAWGNAWLAEMFCDWLRGGARPPNRLRDYMQVAAMVFAAAESARTGKSIDVQEYLASQKEMHGKGTDKGE